jgi:zinc protease
LVIKRVALVLPVVLLFCAGGAAYGPCKASAQANGAGQTSPLVLPIVKRDSLLNGLQIIILEQPGSGRVSTHLRIGSGAMFDLAGKGGLADVTAKMLLRGSSGLAPSGLANLAEETGLNVTITAGWDSTDLKVSGPASELETILDLIGRLVVSPTFDQKELDALKSALISEIKATASEDKEIARRAAIQSVYGSHPYGRPWRGTVESLTAITRPDLTYYHNRFYLANISHLVIAGDATLDQVTKLARSKLGPWKKGDRVPATFRPPEPYGARRLTLINRADSAMGTAAIAQVGYSRRADDYYAASVLTELLKETVKAPGGSVEIEANPRVLAGPIVVSVSASQDQITTVVESILNEIGRFQSGSLPADRIEAAKARLISRMADRLRGNDETAEVILEIELYELGRDYLLNFATRVNAVTAADVQKAAQSYLKPQSVAIAVVATDEKVKESLKKLGPVSVTK